MTLLLAHFWFGFCLVWNCCSWFLNDFPRGRHFRARCPTFPLSLQTRVYYWERFAQLAGQIHEISEAILSIIDNKAEVGLQPLLEQLGKHCKEKRQIQSFLLHMTTMRDRFKWSWSDTLGNISSFSPLQHFNQLCSSFPPVINFTEHTETERLISIISLWLEVQNQFCFDLRVSHAVDGS